MSLLTGIAGGLAGFVAGGPLGAVAGALSGYSSGGAGTSITRATPTSPVPLALPVGPGGGGIFGGMNQQADNWLQKQGIAPKAGACPRGYHLNKHRLPPSKKHGWVEVGTLCVRNRHMHPLNSKAIVHALRRVKRASKIVRKLHAFGPTRRIAARSSGHKAGCGCVVCKRRG